MAEDIPTSNHPDDFLNHRFVFPNLTIEHLKEDHIHWNSQEKIENNPVIQILVEKLGVDEGVFTYQGPLHVKQLVTLIQRDNQINLFCDCKTQETKLCRHQAQVLLNVLRRDDLRIFFSPKIRQQKLRRFAQDYGLANEPSLDSAFDIKYENGQLILAPKQTGLIPVNHAIMENWTNEIIGQQDISRAPSPVKATRPNLIVLRSHKFFHHLIIDLYQAPLSQEGKPKNPFTPIPPTENIWGDSEANELKFLISVAQFQKRSDAKLSSSDILALRTILKNALNCHVYYHNPAISENVSSGSIIPVSLALLPEAVELNIDQHELHFELSGCLTLDQQKYNIRDLPLKFGCFFQVKDTFYLIGNRATLGMIELFKKKSENLLIHRNKFSEFKAQFLDQLEEQIQINYTDIKKATPAQITEHGFNTDVEMIMYLSDLSAFIKISPVVRYSDVEIGVRSKRSIYGMDSQGKEFLVHRDNNKELQLTTLIIKQHPDFRDQIENDLDYFYLHRKHFMDEDWFLQAFDIWREYGITILGFNELHNNKLNPHQAKITVKVVSGINWFNTLVNVQFGKRKASLKKIQLAVRNKNKYIKLDDGTLGILPQVWLEKFAAYFNAGEIVNDEFIQTSRINFASIEQIYDQEMLEDDTRDDLHNYRRLFSDFKNIQDVAIPKELSATLRPYQYEGLKWLNFLDDFNFGGCLADDMGLGKTLQIIAFILTQRHKSETNFNLIVVPSTLVFNWKAEIEKFAPTMKVHSLVGSDRKKSSHDFNHFEVILVSYSTLLSDINYLRKFSFNYIFLDESQNIKNPDTQRYRAARLLQSRNKIVITGTPVENNTFDLYSQFSFACPGLLGNQTYFRAIYSIPIDKFKSSRRARELQAKIQPFLLRRTKTQVASELPEKTEMVLYCEMKPEQRKIYDAYEKEFRDYISANDNEELKRKSMHVLKGLTKLRQICNSPKLIGSETTGEVASKIEMLIEQIEDHVANHKMLIFSQFVSMLDLIKEEISKRDIPFVMLSGRSKNRQALVEEFQNDPNVRIFLVSLKAGGTGLNLTEAEYVYLVDPWWNPAVENQAIDRAHRIGQDKNVTAIRLICPNTIEEKIIKLQAQKKALTDDLIKSRDILYEVVKQRRFVGVTGELIIENG
ncbi:MAG: DEAD/DEAH box helicase [Saprospiraceae bacterium]|nr:DEAD/DEAH box helicase [Saprospiraceae bacterium]